MTYNHGERWEPQNSTIYNQVLVYIDVMPNGNVTFHLNTSTATTKQIHYYVEPLPGDTAETRTFNGREFVEYKTVDANYNFFTEAEDYIEILGFTKFGVEGNRNQIWESGGSSEIWCYYTRDSYTLTFMPNYSNEVDVEREDLTRSSDSDKVAFVTGMTGSEKKTFTVTVPYGQKLSDVAEITEIRNLLAKGKKSTDTGHENFYPLLPDEHQFDGWFTDASATVEVNFNTTTMPAGNLLIYAGMSLVRYRILIDPNGGVMDHINYPVYGSSLGSTGLNIYSTYNDAYATYFNNTAEEFIVTDQEIDNPMVQIDSAEEAQLLAEYEDAIERGENPEYPIYRYINMQYDKGETVQVSGMSYHNYAADARNALYIWDTVESIDEYYQYYVQVLADKNDGDPIPKATWEGLFLSSEKYRKLNSNETYSFLGWFEVDETTGELASTAFDLSKPTTQRTKLQAQWRLEGGYVLHYTPDYTWTGEEDGTEVSHEITGSMDAFYDPDMTSTSYRYADGASTQAMQEPSAIKIDGVPDSEGTYQFRGWQIVRVSEYGGQKHYVVPDEEVGVYYTAGQTITVHGRYAQEEYDSSGTKTEMVIHLRAIYEKRDSSYRRPDVINLTIDASRDGWMSADGTHDAQGEGYVNTTDSTSLPEWMRPGHQYISETTKDVEVESTTVQKPYQILFGDAQSNAAVHLYKYATAAGEVAADGHNYFTHELGYKLIGFDLDAPDNDFVPTYGADSVVAVSPGTSHTLYAVWEPMVYLTFKNSTGVGNVTFNLSGTGRSMYIVNRTSGAFSRVPIDPSQPITLAKDETLMLAAPYGEGETITVNGTNQLGTGYMLSAKTELGVTNPVARTFKSGSVYQDVQNNAVFDFSDELVTDPEGVVITFTATRAPHTLVLNDNYTGGSTKEVNFSSRASDKRVYYLDEDTTSYTLPSTSTRVGYELLGWDEDKTKTDNPTYKIGNWSIADLTAFFTSVSSTTGPDIEIKTLYAIWKANADASTVYVWKDVPEPGDQEKDFTFTVNLGGEFSYTESYNNGYYWPEYRWRSLPTDDTIGTTNAYGSPTLTYDFALKHNQYLKIVTAKRENNVTNGRPEISMTVTKWQRNEDDPDIQLDADDQATGRQDEVELIWRWENTNSPAATPSGTGQYQNFSFGNLNLSVEEADYTATYDLRMNVAAETIDEAFTVDSANRRVSWGETAKGSSDAGGTLIFQNNRKTADITIKKILLPSTLEANSFPYTVKFIDGSGNESTLFETYELNPSTFSVISGTDGYTITGIPTEAKLQITETVDDNLYATSAAGGTPETVTDLNDADNVFTFEVEKNTTVTFTNELRRQKVRIVLVDDETPTPNKLSGGTFTFPGVFDGNRFAAESTGIVFDGEAYVGIWTLTEQTGPGALYRKLQSAVPVTVSKNGVSVREMVNISVSKDGDTYVITVVNPKLMLVTVKKVIEAPAAFFKTGTFGFTATLTDISDPLNPKPVQVSDVIGTHGTNSSGQIEFTLVNNQTVTMYVPRNVKLVVEEEADAAFKTEIQIGTDATSAGAASKQETRVAELNSVTEDRYILFTNTLKTIDVTVKKTVEGQGGTFGFTAFLRYNGAAVQGYELATGIITGDGSGGSTAGKAPFTLEPGYNGTKDVTFRIPSGSVLELAETSLPDGVIYNTSATGVKNSSQTEVGTYNAGNLTITLAANQTVEDLTVTFTNKEVYVAPTGVTTHTKPYIWILFLGGLLALTALPVWYRRRKEDET